MPSTFGRGFKSTFAPTMSATQQQVLKYVLDQPTEEQRQMARMQMEEFSMRARREQRAGEEARELFPLQKQELGAKIGATRALEEMRKRSQISAGLKPEEKRRRLSQLEALTTGKHGAVLQIYDEDYYNTVIAERESLRNELKLTPAPASRGPSTPGTIRVKYGDVIRAVSDTPANRKLASQPGYSIVK